jgi:hypothetical protein
MTDKQIYFILVDISIFSVVLPITLYLLFRKQQPAENRWLFAYLLLCAANELACYVFSRNGRDTALCFNIFGLFEGPMLLMMYNRVGGISRRSYRILMVILLLAGTLVFLDARLNGVLSGVRYLIIGGLAVLYFQSVFRQLEIPFLPDHYFFWINSALLFYFGTTLFITLFEDVLRYSWQTTYYMLWPIQLISNTLRNIILSVGLWKTRTALQYL